jgi:SAM-dependent methyltransferase
MSEQSTSLPADGTAAGPADYGPSYYEHYWGSGGAYERNAQWLGFFEAVAAGIVREIHPLSVLDAGCAMGFLVEALVKQGVDAQGIDISNYAISRVDESIRDRCRVASLTEPLGRRYDLITCIEVIEHVPPEDTETVLANLSQATDMLLLSTTPQDYGEPTHLNVQPPEFWSAALAHHGFYRDLDRDMSFLSPWAALYVRTERPEAETVRAYDRAWWRLRREVGEVRASLLATQQQLSRLEGEKRLEQRDELLSELDQRQEEILRLRDLLAGQDVELGAIKGQMAAMEDSAQRFLNVIARVQARVPGGMRLGGAVLRRLQRRQG